jgi:hypothetical protein
MMPVGTPAAASCLSMTENPGKPAASRRPDAIGRQRPPRPERRVHSPMAFALIPAAIAAAAVLLFGILSTPPRYIARASFAVDWSSLPLTSGDERTEKLRNDCRATFLARVGSLHESESEIGKVLDSAGDFPGNPAAKAAVIPKLHKHLQVTLDSQTDEGDLFTIETLDDDPDAARLAANWVMQGTLSELKAIAEAGSNASALRSESNHAGARIVSRSNIGGVRFDDPVRTVRPARVERRGIGYGVGVLLAALAVAGLAAGTGLLVRQLSLLAAAFQEMARSAARRKQRESAANYRAAIRRQAAVTERPILAQPLPPLWSPR